VKYADDLMLLAKEATALQDMMNRLTETGRCYGVEINMENPQVIRPQGNHPHYKFMIDQKQLDNVKYFSYFSRTLTNDARCTHEIQPKIEMAKAAFNKKTLFTSKLDLYRSTAQSHGGREHPTHNTRKEG
jgi:hypothetical protein